MASTYKDLADSASKFLNTSLDNVKHFIDRTADEVAKADVVGANRRLADHVIESTKETVDRVAECVAKNEPMNAFVSLATGTLDGAKHVVRVAGEETQRINLVEAGSRITQEGLELARRQLEVTFDASKEMGDVVNRMIPIRSATSGTANRPAGVVTRVEIESDKGTIKTEPATRI